MLSHRFPEHPWKRNWRVMRNRFHELQIRSAFTEATTLGMMNETIDQFNKAASVLQATEFRRPRTPGEWQRMNENPPKRDYAKLFAAAVPMIEAFAASGPSDRIGVAAALNPDAVGILRTFAYYASVLAVRRQAPALISQGLVALAVLGEIDDVRDLTFYLAILHHAALKLGIDTHALFDGVASLAPSTSLQTEMRGFPSRIPKDRGLRAFRLRETVTGEGFDFVQEP